MIQTILSSFEVSLGELTFLTIYGLIAGAFGSLLSGYIFPELLQKHKSELEVKADKLRYKLKRQELMFERELHAAQAFFQFYDSLDAGIVTPYGDQDDYQYHIAEKFGRIEKQLQDFLQIHSIAVNEEVRVLISEAKQIAKQGDYEIAKDGQNDPDLPFEYSPSDEIREMVNTFEQKVRKARDKIYTSLETGSFGVTK